MNIDYDGLKSALAALTGGRGAHADLLRVVGISRAVVEAYLKVKMASVAYLYRDQGLTETDLAYDCIAEIFRSDDGRRFPKLDAFASSLGAPLADTPPVELFVALRGLLTLVARAHIAELFHLADPAGGRIYRNIRECVGRHPGLRVTDTLSGLHILAEPARPASRGAAFPPEEMERELASRVGRDRSTGRLLDHVREILASDEQYGGRVRLFDLVQIFRKFHGPRPADTEESAVLPVEGLSEADVLMLRDRCLVRVKEKIFLTYLGKGKLTRREATALYETVAEVIDGWIGGSDGGTPLEQRLTGRLSADHGVYAGRYRAKLEYLVRSAREELASLLSREL